MAFQKGNIKVEGNIGDLNFYKSGDEYRVRQKISKKSKNEVSQIAERTKENAKEFGLVSTFAKNLRNAIKNTMIPHYELFYDSSCLNRLVKRLNLILKADKINERGKRNILPENMMLLKNYSLNSNSALKDSLLLPISIDYHPNHQEISILISDFNPGIHLDIPKETSCFMIHLSILKINHQNMEFRSSYTHSELLPVHQSEQSITLKGNVEDFMESETLLITLGISTYKDVAGYPIPQLSPNLNCLDIIAVYNKLDSNKEVYHS